MGGFSPSDKSGSFAHWVERNGDLMDIRSGDGGGVDTMPRSKINWGV